MKKSYYTFNWKIYKKEKIHRVGAWVTGIVLLFIALFMIVPNTTFMNPSEPARVAFRTFSMMLSHATYNDLLYACIVFTIICIVGLIFTIIED